VFSDATLSDMAQKRPINRIQMLAVSGVGEQKFRQYGEAFINEILDFARENTEPGKTRIVKGFTYVETLDLYQKGMPVEDIAQERKLSPATILGHLVKLHEEGHDINLQDLIPTYEYNQIIAAAMRLNLKKTDPLKPLFEGLEGLYDYGKLRIAMALWDEE